MSMTKRAALATVGGLSNPSKMPGRAWGISPHGCGVGGALQRVKGSVCADCYALKGMYRFASTVTAHERREAAFNADPEAWVAAMVTLLTGDPVFRWLDAGDLRSERMLHAIMDVAERTPRTRHWLPTRETRIVRAVLATRAVPPNLVIRLSSPMVDTPIRFKLADQHDGVEMSHVTTDPDRASCPSSRQGNQCRDCRACWTRGADVTYLAH